MRNWLRRLRGAAGMGLAWALTWAVVGGGLMEGVFDRDGRILDMWPQTLAIPGFLSGIVFSVVLGISERRRQFEELSLARFALIGGATGLALGVLVVGVGLRNAPIPLWLAAAVVAPMTLLSAGAAAGTLMVARRASRAALQAGRVETNRSGHEGT